MYSCGDTPKGWVAPFGYPRIKACSRLPVAFRSVPRPSSPPGAKASTECPSLAQDLSPGTCPGDPPCTETILRNQLSVFSRQLSETAGTKHRHLKPRTILYWIILLSTQQTPLNTSATVAGGPVPKDRPHPVRLATAARPETHQNLIHSNKEQYPSKGAPTASPVRPQNNLSKQLAPQRHRQHRTSCFSAIHPAGRPCSVARNHHLNTIPKARGHGGGDRTRTDDPLLAKQVLSQLSYTPETVFSCRCPVVRMQA